MKTRIALSSEAVCDALVDEFDGIGLIRGEYICRRRGEYITMKACRDAIQDYLVRCCEVFRGKDVWYRFTEFQSNEISILTGADYHLDDERNPLMGTRGIRRAITFPDTFRLELQCVTDVAQKYPNLNVLFPYVRDPSDMEFGVEELRSVSFPNKYGMMAEIPSAILCLEDFLSMGVSNVTIGMNDLTCLTLGTERLPKNDLPKRELFTHPAVLQLVKRAREATQSAGVELSIAGHLTRDTLSEIEALGLDYVVMHYNSLPDLLGDKWSDILEQLPMDEIFRNVRIKVLDRQRQLLCN